MSSLVACLIVVTVGSLIGLTIGYIVLYAEVGWQAANRLFVYAAVVYVFTVAVLIGVMVGFQGSTRRHLGEALLLAGAVLAWAGIGWLLAGRLFGGHALVTLPRLLRQWLALGGALIVALTSLEPWSHPGGSLWILAHAGQISFVLWFVFAALIRPQLRERGVVLFGTFLPWSLLRSYAWEGETGQTLTLRRRRLLTGWLLAYPRLSLRVPVELQEQVDALLRQHLECTEPLRAAEERGVGSIGGSQARRPASSDAELAVKGAPSPLGRVPVPQ